MAKSVPMKKVATILLVAGAVVTLLLLASQIYLKQDTVNKTPVVVEITAGDSAYKIAQNLHRQGVISSPVSLRIWLMIKGLDKKIHVGEYYVEAKMPLGKLISDFVRGKNYQHSFTIVPGETWSQINQRIQKSGMRALTPQETKNLQGRAVSLEGIFMPETYFYVKGEAAYNILSVAKKNQKKRLYEVWNARPQHLEYTSPTHVLVVASMIEKETKLAEERAKVSRVIHNRLKSGMRLQICSSVLYAARSMGITGSVSTLSHLKHPYNTYRFFGLPPGPISTVSKESLYAAANPIEGSWYFYRTLDGQKHIFTNTFAQHAGAAS